MNKIIVFISLLLISSFSFAAQTPAKEPAKIEEGKQYISLPKFASPEKEVIEFFSFNCSACFSFDNEYKGSERIEKNLPVNIGLTIKKYHLEDFGSLSQELAEAWAIANVLGIQQQVSEPLYNGIQKTRTIKTADDIRNIFINIGISGDEFDSMKNNFLVQAFIIQQRTAIKELRPSSIPAFIVNGKYFINPRALDQSSNDSVIEDYSRVINYVLDLND